MCLAFIGKKFNQANLRKLPFPSCLCVFIFPQRQYFPRLGAIAEGPSPLHPFYGPSGQHCPSAPFPHWQHFPRFGAVVVPHFLQRPFHSLRRSCRNPCPTFRRCADFPCFCLTFQRCAIARDLSPSKGAQSPGTLCSACTRVSVSSCLFPPSEGVQISRVSVSPSKGAQSPGTLCSACTRISVSSCLFPPSEGVQIPVFLSHLPKVRKSRIASKRSVVAFVPFMISYPSEGAGRNGILPPPSHFRYVPIRIRDGSRWSCHGSLPGRCRQRWHITVTFLVSL